MPTWLPLMSLNSWFWNVSSSMATTWFDGSPLFVRLNKRKCWADEAPVKFFEGAIIKAIPWPGRRPWSTTKANTKVVEKETEVPFDEFLKLSGWEKKARPIPNVEELVSLKRPFWESSATPPRSKFPLKTKPFSIEAATLIDHEQKYSHMAFVEHGFKDSIHLKLQADFASFIFCFHQVLLTWTCINETARLEIGLHVAEK